MNETYENNKTTAPVPSAATDGEQPSGKNPTKSIADEPGKNKTDEEISMRNDEGNGIAYSKAYILSFLRLIKAGRWKAWCPDIIMPTAAMS